MFPLDFITLGKIALEFKLKNKKLNFSEISTEKNHISVRSGLLYQSKRDQLVKW